MKAERRRLHLQLHKKRGASEIFWRCTPLQTSGRNEEAKALAAGEEILELSAQKRKI